MPNYHLTAGVVPRLCIYAKGNNITVAHVLQHFATSGQPPVIILVLELFPVFADTQKGTKLQLPTSCNHLLQVDNPQLVKERRPNYHQSRASLFWICKRNKVLLSKREVQAWSWLVPKIHRHLSTGKSFMDVRTYMSPTPFPQINHQEKTQISFVNITHTIIPDLFTERMDHVSQNYVD